MILNLLKKLLGMGEDSVAPPAPATRRHRPVGKDEKDGKSTPAPSAVNPQATPSVGSAPTFDSPGRAGSRQTTARSAAPVDTSLASQEPYCNMLPDQLFDVAYQAWDSRKYDISASLFMALAEQGFERAYAYVGLAYELSQGVAYDEQAMLHYYHMAIDARQNVGLYRLGMYLMDRQRYEEAAELYQRAIDEGWNGSDAFFHMGEMYENGWGVPRDVDKAVEYYRQGDKKKDLDCSQALDRLGIRFAQEDFSLRLPGAMKFRPARELYFEGEHITWLPDGDMPLAVAYLMAALDKGYALAAYKLAEIFSNSKWPIYDEEQARKYGAIAYEGMLQQAKEDPIVASDAGNAYSYGAVGCKQDLQRARQCYEYGAAAGNMHCLWHLGDMERKAGHKQEAFSLLLQGAEAGQGMAMFAVAECFEKGEGTAVDRDKAKYWYTKCAEAPFASASAARARLEAWED